MTLNPPPDVTSSGCNPFGLGNEEPAGTGTGAGAGAVGATVGKMSRETLCWPLMFGMRTEWLHFQPAMFRAVVPGCNFSSCATCAAT